MTPTEQAADRVKALVEKLRGDGSSWAQPLFNEAADALTALQARAEDAERRVEEMEQADSRWVIRFSEVREASGIGYAPMLSEVPAAIRAKLGGYEFVCALMAAAAETLEGLSAAEWKAEYLRRHEDVCQMMDRAIAAEARVGELEGDALRYRYLKEHHTSNYGMTREQPAEWTLCWDWQQIRPGEEFLGLDALIDADIARLDDDDRALLTPPLEQE